MFTTTNAGGYQRLGLAAAFLIAALASLSSVTLGGQVDATTSIVADGDRDGDGYRAHAKGGVLE